MRVTKAIKAQARCSRGLWAPRSIGLATKIRLGQALVRSVLRYAAEAHAWQPRDVETLEEDPCSCVSRVDAGPGLEHTQWCQRCKFGSYSGQRSGCEKKPLQAYWESIFHVRNPQETRSGENGCLRYLRRISASCCRMLQEMTSGQSNNRVRSSRVRNVEQESEVKEASKYISSSGVGKALAKRRQRHVQKPRQGCRDLSETRNSRARIAQKNSPLDQTALLMSAHHVATDLHSHMCQRKHQQHQRPLSVTTECRYQHKQRTP